MHVGHSEDAPIEPLGKPREVSNGLSIYINLSHCSPVACEASQQEKNGFKVHPDRRFLREVFSSIQIAAESHRSCGASLRKVVSSIIDQHSSEKLLRSDDFHNPPANRT